MKLLKYQKAIDTDSKNIPSQHLMEIEIRCDEKYLSSNIEIAKAEAYQGKYEVIDEPGTPNETNPSQIDRIEAQVAYTAMMTNTILEEQA